MPQKKKISKKAPSATEGKVKPAVMEKKAPVSPPTAVAPGPTSPPPTPTKR